MRIAASPIDLNPSTKADPAKIDKVSRQLEGQFAQMLVKSMRNASSGDPMFPGENQMFREMYDQQMAKALTQGKGLGLSAMISKQLSGDTGGPALNTALNTAEAAKAYSLVAGKRDASLPLPTRDGAASGITTSSVAKAALSAGNLSGIGMSQVLDLIAGRTGAGESGSDDAAALSWPSANDRWTDVAASDAADANAAVNASAASTAAASLGERTPEASSPRSGRMRRKPRANWAWTHARWWHRPHWKPAGAVAASAMGAIPTTCSASRPPAGAATRSPPAPTNTSTASKPPKPPISAPMARPKRALPTTCGC